MSEKADRAELEALREALIEGEKSGVVGPLDIERIKGEAVDVHRQRQRLRAFFGLRQAKPDYSAYCDTPHISESDIFPPPLTSRMQIRLYHTRSARLDRESC
jgi:hypothetical protein